MKVMRVIAVAVLLMGVVASGNALVYFEASNGWGLPGTSGNPTIIYGNVDDTTSAFQLMVCFDPSVLQLDTFSVFGAPFGSQTVFDTAWGGVGPMTVAPYVDNNQGFFQIAVLYDITLQNKLYSMNRTPLIFLVWSVNSNATIPTLSAWTVSEDCGDIHTDCVFSTPEGVSIYPDTLLGGTFFVIPEGDANGDGMVNFGDINALSSFLYFQGDAPTPAGTVNGDCAVGFPDIGYLGMYLYLMGADPVAPPCPWEKWVSPLILGKNSGHNQKTSTIMVNDPSHAPKIIKGPMMKKKVDK